MVSASGRPPAGAGGGMQEESSPRLGSQTSGCSHLVPSDLRLSKQPSLATPSFQWHNQRCFSTFPHEDQEQSHRGSYRQTYF